MLFIIIRNVNANTNEFYLYKGITTCKTPICDKPSFYSTVIDVLEPNTPVKVYQAVANWDEGSSYKIIKYKDKWGFVPFYDIENIDMYKKTISANKIKTYNFISLEGKLKKGSYEDLLKSYLLLPNYVRSMFQIEGFTLRMTENDVQYEAYGPNGYSAGKLHAVFDYEVKKMWTNDENPRYIVHEMGHYVNDRLGMFVNKPEYKQLFKTEGAKISVYSNSNINEYYAECFDMYFRCPTLLIQLSPASYNMIEKSLSEFYNLASKLLPPELL